MRSRSRTAASGSGGSTDERARPPAAQPGQPAHPGADALGASAPGAVHPAAVRRRGARGARSRCRGSRTCGARRRRACSGRSSPTWNGASASSCCSACPAEKRERDFSQAFTSARIADIKGRFGDAVWVAADVCLCSYTTHGHCGILADDRTHLDNDVTVAALAAAALQFAHAGADCVAPSDMQDGRVAAIRAALDGAGFQRRALMSYAAKFHSAFYGPFRVAADSAPDKANSAEGPGHLPDRSGPARRCAARGAAGRSRGRRHPDGEARPALPGRARAPVRRRYRCPGRCTRRAASRRASTCSPRRSSPIRFVRSWRPGRPSSGPGRSMIISYAARRAPLYLAREAGTP